MDRQIPIYFNDVSFSSPLSPIGNSEEASNIGEAQVRVFTKYRNRNGSYITDEVAEQLIQSTLGGTVPVVGFFDPETDDFTSHTWEDLANAYGYCKDFVGWEKHMDNDGFEREYAVFTVILFTNYFTAANKIIGNPQSMELDRNSITGDWVRMEDGAEYFVYKTAKMKGFTVLGKNVEPCFQGASFFSCEDGESKFDKFSALLVSLKEKVEAEYKNVIGGEDKMNFNISGIECDKYSVLFEKLNPDFNEENGFKVNEVIYEMTEDTAYTFSCKDKKQRKYTYSVDEEGNLNYEAVEEFGYDAELVAEHATLQETYNTLNADFEAQKTANDELTNKVSEYEAQIEEFNTNINSLNEKITEYENIINQIETEKKNALIDTYQNAISEEEISEIRETASNFSYEEVEQKLALTFARKNINSAGQVHIGVPEPEESDFAKLMKNYRKN